MYKLQVTLKQHTPLIHFQHDQDGATLRASEVKPKLDRFILEKLKSVRPDLYNEYEDIINVIPGRLSTVSSPYKLSIHVKDENDIDKYVVASFIPKYKIPEYSRLGYKVLDKTPYFADNKPVKDGKIEDCKLGVMLKDTNSLLLSIRFLDMRWKNFFREILPIFFVTTNFGSRQNKGFGCFIPSDLKQITFENALKDNFGDVYRNLEQYQSLDKVFFEIDKLYKRLKSGIQGKDGELRKYFNDFRPMIDWEKPRIQEEVSKIPNIRSRIRIDRRTNNIQFARALLGLPELYEYPKHGDIKVLVEGSEKEKDNHNPNKACIQRYASPLLFKVFNGNIYIVADSKSEILYKSFDFFIQEDRKFSLRTPSKFDVKDFLSIAMLNQKWKKL